MKQYLFILLFFLNFVSIFGQKSIVVFFENDVHCKIAGYPYLSGLRNSVSTDSAYVGIVSSGDYIQGGTIGAISKGEAILSITKHIGYDAMGLGNHEFDYDVQYLQKLVKKFDVPVVCSNFVDNDGNYVFNPYRICEYGDKKIAYIGVTTPNTLYAKPSAFKDINKNTLYSFSRNNIYGFVQKTIDSVRDKADFVVLLSHIGEDPDSIKIDSHDLIANTSGVDVVLDAHTHSVVPPFTLKNIEGKDVLLAQTGTQFANIGKIVFSSDGKISAELIPLFSGDEITTPIDRSVEHFVDSISDFYANITDMPVGISDFELCIHDPDGQLAVRCKETNAGDIVADAIREIAQTDIAMVNGGGIRNKVPAGNLKRGDIIAMCPYDNTICQVTVTGKQIESILNASVKFLPQMHGNFPQVSGIRFKINVQEGGDNYVSNIEILDKKTNSYLPVSEDRLYTLSTSDYYITSDQFNVLKGQYKDYINHHILYSQAVIYLIHDKYQGKVPSRYQSAEGRIMQ